MKQLLGFVIGVVHDESIIVWRKWSTTKLYDLVGMNFLWPCYFEKTWLLWLVCLKNHHFQVNMNFYFVSFGSEHSCYNKENYIEIMPSSTPHQKFWFYHLPTQGREELSLGMLIHLQHIYNLWNIHAIILSVLNDYGLYYTLLYYFWD